MGRPALSDSERDRFRSRLVDVALEMFAKRGIEGFSLRGLAAEMGCSHQTPYRYFSDQAEVFSAVRAEGFRRFRAFLQTATKGAPAPADRVRRLSHAYLEFSRTHHDAFRVMFELGQKRSPDDEELNRELFGAWSQIEDAAQQAIRAGILVGDAGTLAHLLWAAVHGVVALESAERLTLGLDAPFLVDTLVDSILDAHAPAAAAAPA